MTDIRTWLQSLDHIHRSPSITPTPLREKLTGDLFLEAHPLKLLGVRTAHYFTWGCLNFGSPDPMGGNA